VRLSQYPLRPLVQLGALAQQPRIAYAQVEEALLKTASWCDRRVGCRLLGGAEH
jgi:hypothetical protein